jgi:zinc transport system substrate-binding protein
MLSGCTQSGAPEARRLSIVAAIFPQYDWIREILGDTTNPFDITLLIDNQIDMHSYQPSVRDIVTVGSADLFIHAGGHSDDWVEGVLRQATNPDIIVINQLDLLRDPAFGDLIRMQEAIEGSEHICDDDCDDDHSVDGPLHEDEHVWVSLRLAKILCTVIANVLSELDPGNAEAYHGNLAAYIERLSALDEEYQAAADAAEIDTLVFADRFPFRYLMDDYGLNYYAAFSGCSAASEASFSTIVFLATKVAELGLNNVMVTETGNHSIARAVINSTPGKDQQILVLDGMKMVTRRDIDAGMTYLSIMEDNLEVLREALR